MYVPLPGFMAFSTVCGSPPTVTGPQALVNHTPPADLYAITEAQPGFVSTPPTTNDGHVNVTLVLGVPDDDTW